MGQEYGTALVYAVRFVDDALNMSKVEPLIWFL